VFYKQFIVVHFNDFRANSLTMVTMPKHVVVKELKNCAFFGATKA